MKKNEHSETLRIAVLRVSGKPVRGYRLPLFNSDAPGQTQPLRGHKDQLTVTQQGAEEDPVKKARQEAKYLKGDVLKTNLNKKRLTAAWKTNSTVSLLSQRLDEHKERMIMKAKRKIFLDWASNADPCALVVN